MWSRRSHGRRIAALTRDRHRDRPAARRLRARPEHAARQGDARSRRARSTDNTVLLVVMTPFTVFILALPRATRSGRLQGAEGRDGAARRRPMRGHMPSQIAWLVTTTVAVLFLAIFGTTELLADNGAGGGGGPNPVAKPSGIALPVQVIGQQWEFTYRYPTYGGVETAELVLPVGRAGRLPRHVARRGPFVLGVRARRQGGREPRRRQRRLREAEEDRHLPDPLRRALRALARLHVRHRPRRQPGRVHDLDRGAAAAVRRRREVPAEVRAVVLPRPDLPRRMNLRRLFGFNLLTAVVLGVVGFYVGWWLGHQIKGPSIEYFGDTHQNDIALFVAYLVGVVGFLVGLGFANYPVQRLLGKPPTLREKEQQGIGPLLRPLHRSQGRRHPVPARHRRVHLHRRPERDADPVRVDAPDAPRLERQQLPHPGRGARHDDDGDDDERDPRPVRELLRPVDDRRAADGVPAHRGADVLAPDGGRDDPDDDASPSAASRPAGRATRR